MADGGGEATTLLCDVTDAAQVTDGIGALPRIDVLVNNAGINIPEPFLEVSEEHLDRILNLNVRGAFLVAQAAARRMVAQGGGSIVNISSQMGHVGSPRRSVYCMSKHGVRSLTETLAAEWAARGVRVNAISPGFFLTDLNRDAMSEARKARALARVPMRRFGEVDELAGAAVYLASPSARYVTGATIPVDGGFLAMGM